MDQISTEKTQIAKFYKKSSTVITEHPVYTL